MKNTVKKTAVALGVICVCLFAGVGIAAIVSKISDDAGHSDTNVATPKMLTIQSEQTSTANRVLDATICAIQLPSVDIVLKGAVNLPTILLGSHGNSLSVQLTYQAARTFAIGDWKRFKLREVTTIVTFDDGTTGPPIHTDMFISAAKSPLRPPSDIPSQCVSGPKG